jgi:hypothetical protein
MASPEGEPRLTLHLLDAEHELPVEELEPEPSPHTGRPLRRVRVWFRVPAEDSKTTTDVLGRARDAEHALVSPDGSRWVVVSSSHSNTQGDRLHRHEAELREAEEIRAERLELLSLTLAPTRYKEEAEEDGGLFISARVEPDHEVDAALEQEVVRERSEDLYFDVLRVGVSDTPVRVRFGRCLWQRTEHGRAHLLRLVSEAGDSEERLQGYVPLSREPEFSIAARKAAAAEEAIEALLDELRAAGTLSSEAIERVHTRAGQISENQTRDFDEARDLDEYF